jgi:hypothetical protein
VRLRRLAQPDLLISAECGDQSALDPLQEISTITCSQPY